MKRRRCKLCGQLLGYDREIGYYCGTPKCPWMQRWWRDLWAKAWDAFAGLPDR